MSRRRRSPPSPAVDGVVDDNGGNHDDDNDNRHAQRTVDREPGPEFCPLCGREIPASQRDAHHLVPKLKGGTETVALHRICHRAIHARFTETELARAFNPAEALLAHDDIARFVAWVKKKPPEFHDQTRVSNQKRGPRGAR